MNDFERGGNPLERLDIGGFSFDTLRPGAILKAKRFFGVTKTGTLGGISRAIRINRDNYLLVILIENENPNTKTIHWQKFFKLEDAKEQKQRLKNKEGLSTWGITKGFLHDITKRKFDYRLEVIESGFNESEKSIRSV